MTLLRSLLALWAGLALAASGHGQDGAKTGGGGSPPERDDINPALPTVFIAGDSTAARARGDVVQGWGVPFADYFDPTKVNIANRARSGRSSRTFVTEGLWEQLLVDVKPGDTILIQFGHNDGGSISSQAARGSLPGVGEETREIQHPLTGQTEIVRTYGWYLRKMIADAKERGARPIVLSPTVRNEWTGGRLLRGPARHSRWAYEAARMTAVPFVEVMHAMADRFEILGEEKVRAFYPQDATHFNQLGAELHAAQVVAGLKGLRPSPVADVLSAKGDAVAADRHAWLRLPWPADVRLPSLVLVGDSTVRNGRGDGVNGQWGWGDFLSPYFDLSRINLVNRAVGGTGVRSYVAAGHWENTLALVKPGDVVVLQFGHNDNGPKAPLRGIGEETEERETVAGKPPEIEHTWGWHLRRYVADIRARGATPIICSLVPRKMWRQGRIVRTADAHADWARAVADREGVAFIDLHERIAQKYETLGEEPVNALFADERVHTSALGAEVNAGCFVEGLAALPDNPLAPYLRRSPQPSENPAGGSERVPARRRSPGSGGASGR